MREQKLIPELRFPEFTEKWQEKAIDTIFDRVVNAVEVEKEQEYQEIGIRSHGKGIFHKEPVFGKALGNKRVFWLEKDLFIVNIVFAWEMAVAKTTEKENGLIASHRFPMYKPKVKKLDLDFILFFFLRKKGKHILELASPGGAGRNKTLGQKEFAKSKVIVPKDITEQQKIGSFLLATEEKIKQLQEKNSLLEEYKKGVMQQIFNQEVRFKDDNGNEFKKWKVCSVDELVTEINLKSIKNNQYPILSSSKTGLKLQSEYFSKQTASQNNIGYKVLSINDFTYRSMSDTGNFTFNQLKSISKGIISPAYPVFRISNSKNIDNDFLYYFLNNSSKVKKQILVLKEGGTRFAMGFSKFRKIKIDCPEKKEQSKIVDFLKKIDEKIQLVNNQLKNTKAFKKGLLQKMFV